MTPSATLAEQQITRPTRKTGPDRSHLRLARQFLADQGIEVRVRNVHFAKMEEQPGHDRAGKPIMRKVVVEHPQTVNFINGTTDQWGNAIPTNEKLDPQAEKNHRRQNGADNALYARQARGYSEVKLVMPSGKICIGRSICSGLDPLSRPVGALKALRRAARAAGIRHLPGEMPTS